MAVVMVPLYTCFIGFCMQNGYLYSRISCYMMSAIDKMYIPCIFVVYIYMLVASALCLGRDGTLVNLWSGLKDCLPFSVFSTLCTRLSYIVMYHALQTKECSKMNFQIFLLNFRCHTQKQFCAGITVSECQVLYENPFSIQ